MYGFSQNKSDYTWIFGTNYNDSIPGTEGTVIDFNDNHRSINYQPIFPTQSIGNSTATISDENSGELLFFSNGCAIFDRSFNQMANGDSINQGGLRDYYCEETQSKWYPYGQGLLIIKVPNSDSLFYLIHKTEDWNEDLTDIFYDKIRYTVVDMSLNDGLGEVILKNEILYQGDELALGYLTMIPHQNKKDWWLIQPKLNSNEFIRILVTDNGFLHLENQIIGDSIAGQGQAMFSPDGSMFAAFNGVDHYHLYDFDRDSGLLSNYRSLKFDDRSIGLGMSFSPSSQFSYLMRRTKIYQVDNTLDVLSDGLILIDTLTQASEGFTASFVQATLAPDCKIYITHLSATRFLTVIHDPDAKGKDCNLIQRDLRMPFFHDIAAIPNFPHFRIDEEDICDPTITNIGSIPYQEDSFVEVFPNPSSGLVNIWTNQGLLVHLLSLDGRLIENYGTINGKREVDISSLNSGMYFLHFVDKYGHRITKKLFKL